MLVKRTDSATAGNWYMEDMMRGIPVNGNGAQLYANTSGAESASNIAYPNATGFTWNIGIANYSGIYIAIRRPMKTPESGTEVFAQDTRSSDEAITTNFPVDAVIGKNNHGNIRLVCSFPDRLRGTTPSSSVYLTNKYRQRLSIKGLLLE